MLHSSGRLSSMFLYGSVHHLRTRAGDHSLKPDVVALLQYPAGGIACVLWGVREQQGVDPSGRRYRHVCDCHLVTLAVAHPGTSSCGLSVSSIQQVQVAPGPPSAAWLSPGDLNLWLLSEPPLECTGAAQPAAGAAAPTAAAAAGSAGIGAGSSSSGPVPIDDEDEGDDIDPRTLEQAAARLAAYTSDTPVGETCLWPFGTS